MIRGVAELWASEFVPKAGKVVNSQASLVEVDDFALREKHKLIENLENIRVWLMDGADHSPSTGCQFTQGLTD